MKRRKGRGKEAKVGTGEEDEAPSNKMIPRKRANQNRSTDRMAGPVLTGGTGGSSFYLLSHTCRYAGWEHRSQANRNLRSGFYFD